MKLAFPNGEHNDVTIGKGSLSIGSSDDDDVVIKADGVEPGHAVIIVDKRGMTLSIDSGGEHVSLNERPIREKAILRLGDDLSVGAVHMVLQADVSRMSTPPTNANPIHESSPTAPPKFLLRCIAGKYFGRALPIRESLLVGSGENCDVVLDDEGIAAEHVAIELSDAGVLLRKRGAVNGSLVNGISVDDAVLQAGDQVVFGRSRFVIEAPGFVPGKAFAPADEEKQESNTQVFSALDLSKEMGNQEAKKKADEAEPAEEAGSAGSIGARDAIIIGVCVVLSAFMLIWLYLNI